jgi:hypothetical protein
MTLKSTLISATALTLTVFVASTLAQGPPRTRGGLAAESPARSGVATFSRAPNTPSNLLRQYAKPHLETADEIEAQTRVEALTRQLQDVDSDAEREDIKGKLSDALGKQFDLRQKRHVDEIKALEAKVKKLKQLVETRQENRAAIILRKLDQIMNDAEGLGF